VLVRLEELPRHLAGAQARAAQVNGAAGADLPGVAEAIWQAVAPLLPGFTVEVAAELDSTNSELMRRARSGRAEPVLLVAQRQTAGRGRLGRTWHAEAGSALTFSLALPLAPADWSGLSLAVGVALAESLHPDIRLKWPNDLWLHGRKLGGILIETASTGVEASGPRYAVIGAGINLAPPSAAGLATAPAWLGELLPQAQPGPVLLQLAPPLVEALLLFERAGFAAFRTRFDARDALRGHAIVLSDGTAGTAAGTNEQGALLVHTAGAVKALTSSEVSVRPAA
jgi:BirA family biotin operon repressor/biotin-[acetyl-CoA-carboxylase] ligase